MMKIIACILKIIAYILNCIFLVFIGFIFIFPRGDMPSGGYFWLLLLMIAFLIVSSIVLLLSHKTGGLGLYFHRHALEEKTKIEALKEKKAKRRPKSITKSRQSGGAALAFEIQISNF
ncbi:MAG: hypothetical protein ACYS9Y_02780 [Planctomycetota bacterium]|jgi:hypothetical protein